MASVIIIDSKIEQAQINNTLQAVAASSAFEQTLLISDQITEVSDSSITLLSPNNELLSADIYSALEKTESEVIVFIDPSYNWTDKQLSSLMANNDISDYTLSFASLKSGNDLVELPNLSADALVSAFTRTTDWPMLAVSVQRSFLVKEQTNALSTGEYLGKMLINAIAEGCAINENWAALKVNNSEDLQKYSQLEENQLAECLRHVVTIFNIEDLFPNHPWQQHGNESAAACYHSLSAMFIRLNDAESALECLSLSDQLEDSPRSLALKGLIALNKGETLQAVANMVSSLQVYEKRKVDDTAHYLRFAPQNIEVINNNLQSGLEALNKRDNDTAIGHFSNAVFQFDSFYQEFGLDRSAK